MCKTLACFLFLQLLCISAVPAQQHEHVLIVSGQGVVEVEPDMATLTIGVTTVSPGAQQAYAANNEKMSLVIEQMKELGIAAPDIKTTRFSMGPTYDYTPGTGERKFKGYRVNHTLTLTVRDLRSIGQVLDQTVSAGVTDLSGVSFGVQDSEEMEAAARRQAVEDAHTKAVDLAEAAQVALGPPIRIEESGRAPTPYARSFEAVDAESIEPGIYRITSGVTVHYRIE